jgi:hypothetical protein
MGGTGGIAPIQSSLTVIFLSLTISRDRGVTIPRIPTIPQSPLRAASLKSVETAAASPKIAKRRSLVGFSVLSPWSIPAPVDHSTASQTRS